MLAVVLLVTGCDPAAPESTVPSASATNGSAPTSALSAAATQGPTVTDATDAASRVEPVRTHLARLTPVDDGAEGQFSARTVDGRPLRVALATRRRPRSYRKPLAAYRIAAALGLHVVPPTAVTDLPIAQLATLLESQSSERRQAITERLVVRNDGTVRALLREPCVGRPLSLSAGQPVEGWAELAASSAPLGGRTARSVTGYVQLVVLDFLTGNVLRRTVAYDEQSGRLCADDHDGAFPGYLGADGQELLLRRLRRIQRFPAGLDERLAQLDRAAVTGRLQPGRFTDWLVAPRPLLDLMERRTTLRTLLHARVQQHGASAVLPLVDAAD